MSFYARIPLMYHPTTVVLLDDDRKILNNIRLILDDDIPYLLEDDPQKVVDYLKSNTYNTDSLSKLVVEQNFDSFDPADFGNTETFNINFARLQQTLTSPDRFKRVTAAMIDRRMRIDGLKFCETIRKAGLLLKLILFTGYTSKEEAVKAFNQKTIDGFMVKDGDPSDSADEINFNIRENSWQQFVDLSQSLTGLLSHLLKPLHNEDFIKVFDKIRRENQAIEFYLLDSSCSFLMVDADGKAKQLLVRNESDFESCCELAENAERPKEILETLKKHEKFPATKDLFGYVKLKDEDWTSSLVSMNKIPNQNLYYAVIDRPEVEIFSFNQYVKEFLVS